MVQIIKAAQPKKTFASEFGSGLGEGLRQGLSEAGNTFADKINRNRENEFFQKNYGLDLRGANDPQTRQQIISTELPYYRQMKQAKASHAAYDQQYPETQQGESRQVSGEERTPSQNKGGKNFPQEATRGEKVPIMTPEQMQQRGLQYARDRTAQGVPTTAEQGIQLAEQENQRNETYNNKIDQEKNARIAEQQRYGQKANDMLLKLYPNATDEQQAVFRRYGENESFEGKSEADIDRALSKKAAQFKNTISDVQNSVVSAPRIGTKLWDLLQGTSRNADQTIQDMRLQLKPLLDQGLNDTARMLLEEKGYYPEERERIVSGLGEYTKKYLAEMPSIPKEKAFKPMGPSGLVEEQSQKLNPEQAQVFTDTLDKILKTDPSVNLILLRKEFEDKNINWRDYKDALNLSASQGFEFNDDQLKQLEILNSPPLSILEKHLYKLGLIGK